MIALKALVLDEKGQSMVEYGIIVAVIAAICVLSFRAIGGEINKKLETLLKNMK